MMRTLGGDRRITPVDALMIMPCVMFKYYVSYTTLYETVRTTWWGYGIAVDLL